MCQGGREGGLMGCEQLCFGDFDAPCLCCAAACAPLDTWSAVFSHRKLTFLLDAFVNQVSDKERRAELDNLFKDVAQVRGLQPARCLHISL